MDSELIKQFEMFYEILIKTATTGYTPQSKFQDARDNYSQLRIVLTSNSGLKTKIPEFIIDNPTLDDFGKYIRKELPNSNERRSFLKDAFSIARASVHDPAILPSDKSIPQTIPASGVRLKEIKVDSKDKENKMHQQLNDSVFIVHGRANEIKETTARFLGKLEINPIILHEKPDKGRTIIEKFEDHSAEARFAVILLTPDDLGRLASEPETSLKPRARQNVIFEMGYFIGSLGRGKVCALYHGVEQPSDLHGVIYIPIDEAGAWKTHLAKELKEAGIKADYEKVIE